MGWLSDLEGWWNDGVSFLSDLFGTVSGDIGRFARWVLTEIKKAADLVENDLQDALGVVKGVALDAINHIAEVESALGTVITQTIPSFFQKAWHEAAHLFDDARHDTAHWFDVARHDIAGVGHDVAHDFDSARHEAAHLFDDARHDAAHELDIFRKDVVDPLERDVKEAYRLAVEAEHFIVYAAEDAVHLVEKCWKFLEWVAEHPLAALERLPAIIEQDVLVPATTVVEKEAKGVFDDLNESLSVLLPEADTQAGT